MAKRKKARRRRPKKKIPLGVTSGLAAGMIQPIEMALSGDLMNAFDQVTQNYTGFTRSGGGFSADGIKRGLVPLLAGAGISLLARKSGLNRLLSDIPFIKI